MQCPGKLVGNFLSWSLVLKFCSLDYILHQKIDFFHREVDQSGEWRKSDTRDRISSFIDSEGTGNGLDTFGRRPRVEESVGSEWSRSSAPSKQGIRGDSSPWYSDLPAPGWWETAIKSKWRETNVVVLAELASVLKLIPTMKPGSQNGNPVEDYFGIDNVVLPTQSNPQSLSN